MPIEYVKMSSRGQIVIPQKIREEFDLKQGMLFAVLGNKDTIIFKKINMLSKEEIINEISKIAEKGTKKANELGIKEKHIQNLIKGSRKKKN